MRAVDTAVLNALTAVLDNVEFGSPEVDDSGQTVVYALPSVVIRTNVGRDGGYRLSDQPGARDVPYRIYFTGRTEEQAIWAGVKVRDALGDVSLSVDGQLRVCRWVDNPAPIVRDEDVKGPNQIALYTGSDEYAVEQSTAH